MSRLRILRGCLCLTLAGTVLLCNAAAAATLEIGEPFIRNFSPEEYQGHAQVWTIIEDTRGILYFGTTSGIHEYDGTNWRHIEIGDKTVIRSMAISKAGQIFVGGIKELGYLATDRDGKMEYISIVDEIPPDYREFKDVWYVFATTHGVYYVTVDRTFRWHGDQMTVIPTGAKDCAVALNDNIYLHTASGLERISEGDRTPMTGVRFMQDEFGVVRGYPFPDGNQILLYSSKKGLLLFSVDTPLEPDGTVRVVAFPNQANDYIKRHRAYKMTPISDDAVAISTITGGIVVLGTDGRLVRIVNTNRGLAKDTVFSLHCDRFGNLWAGMQGGIAHIEVSSPLSFYGKNSGLPGSVNTITRFKDEIYTGTIASGAVRLKPYELSIEDDKYDFTPLVEPPIPYTWSFLTVNDTLLIGSKNLLRLDGREKNVAAIPKTPVAYAMKRSSRFPGVIFLGIAEVSGGGLGILRYRNDDSESDTVPSAIAFEYDGKMEGIKNTIRDIDQDQDGNLWLSTLLSGLMFVRFKSEDPADFEIVRLTDKNGLPGNSQLQVVVDGERILVTTGKGIYQYMGDEMPRPEGIQFEPHQAFESAFENPSSGISVMEVYGENKWVVFPLATHGIVTRHPSGAYEAENRPFRAVSNESSYARIDDDGVIWFGAMQVLYRYDPAVKKNYDTAYRAVIRNVRTNLGRDVFWGAYFDPASRRASHYRQWTNRQPESMKPTFEYEENAISFEYSAPFFESGPETVYQYRLEGFDKGWSEWSKRTRKEYTNIPEGSYTFTVRARNIYETLSEVASYQFAIRPPWYRTVWAYALYVLMFFALLFGGILLTTRRLRQGKIRLEKIVQRRTEEVVKQRDEIAAQKDIIEEARNALWGEMELAKKIQTVLLPKSPDIPGYEIAGYMDVADEVGGDYYDVINVHGKNWLVIGDVSGHGVPAGLVMMMVQTAIRTALDKHGEMTLDQILSWVNRTIYANISKLGEMKYMTLTIMSFESNGAILYSGLHQDIMVYRKQTDEVVCIETDGIWLGIADDIEGMNRVDSLTLAPGDAMLLFTDGIVESTDANGEMYSDERLRTVFEACGSGSAQAIKDSVIKSLNGFTTSDDVTLMVVRRAESADTASNTSPFA